MKEQIKELCFFMICGQTLLFFQNGRKYEKICRMILELLILAGIIGILLSVFQELGFQKGEITADGGVVSNMQRSMSEALSKQLDGSGESTDLFRDFSSDQLFEKYTFQEMKSKYNYIARRNELEMEEIERHGNGLRIFVKQSEKEAEQMEETETKPEEEKTIEKIEIPDITIDERMNGKDTGKNKDTEADMDTDGSIDIGSFRKELADIFLIDEKNLEVILID